MGAQAVLVAASHRVAVRPGTVAVDSPVAAFADSQVAPSAAGSQAAAADSLVVAADIRAAEACPGTARLEPYRAAFAEDNPVAVGILAAEAFVVAFVVAFAAPSAALAAVAVAVAVLLA